MNSIKRVWSALNREPGDRIPIHTVFVDGNICAEVLGKPPRSAFDVIDDLEEQYPNDWVERINAITGEIEINVFSRAIETAAAIGYDTCGAGYIPFKFESKERMTDVFGRIYKIVNDHGNIFPYYVDGLIKNQKDWEDFPKPNLKEIYKRAKKFYKTIQRRIKKFKNPDFCLMAQDDYCSVFPPVWQGMGMTPFARALRKNPKMIEERFEQTTEFVLGLFKTYADCGAKIFFEGGDIAFKSGPLVNPRYINKYVVPCMKRVTEAVHGWGGKIIFHSDGDITSLLDFVVDCGFDALHCLEPPYVDLNLVKKKVGNKLCLLGNIDTTHILVNATKKEVENAVKYAIKALGPGGGYILSPSNSHPAMSYQRVKWMIEATKKFGVYPLQI
ncbi:MAG: uroporphyrinogen decarboxylase family protein [Promethearchaeota archaeon]